MRQRRIIRTTLGDLIVAVTEEVMPIVRDPADAYVLVSWILNDLLTHHRVPDHKQSRLKYQSNSKCDENVKEIGRNSKRPSGSTTLAAERITERWQRTMQLN